jgi:penicillin G amidase
MVNRGPVATSGTGSAINATGWSAASPGFEVNALPSERVIYDLSDWDASLSMHTTGQSGHPASPHYDDMIDPWRMIEYRPMVWTRAAVEAAAVSILILAPGE